MTGVAAYKFLHREKCVPQQCMAELQNGSPIPLAQVEAQSLQPHLHRTSAEFYIPISSS